MLNDNDRTTEADEILKAIARERQRRRDAVMWIILTGVAVSGFMALLEWLKVVG